MPTCFKSVMDQHVASLKGSCDVEVGSLCGRVHVEFGSLCNFQIFGRVEDIQRQFTRIC